jgi:hypothetical protein
MKYFLFLSVIVLSISLGVMSFKTMDGRDPGKDNSALKDSLASVKAFMGVYKVLMSPVV